MFFLYIRPWRTQITKGNIYVTKNSGIFISEYGPSTFFVNYSKERKETHCNFNISDLAIHKSVILAILMLRQ
jgi:hypothetical protein